MEWIKFSNKLPTEKINEQVKIFFCEPTWATFGVGLYRHNPEKNLKENVWHYNLDDDSYYSWTSRTPTHWMLSPELPKKRKYEEK